jgi:hypothetical protein
MLQPASVSLISPCVPKSFNEDYQAYAFLFCMLAALLLHAFDHLVEYKMLQLLDPDHHGHSHGIPPESHCNHDSIADATRQKDKTQVSSAATVAPTDMVTSDFVLMVPAESPAAHSPVGRPLPPTEKAVDKFGVDTYAHMSSLHEGHVHSVLLVQGVNRTISACAAASRVAKAEH